MFECYGLSDWNNRGKWTLSAYPKSRKHESLADSAEILMTVSLCGHVLLGHVSSLLNKFVSLHPLAAEIDRKLQIQCSVHIHSTCSLLNWKNFTQTNRCTSFASSFRCLINMHRHAMHRQAPFNCSENSVHHLDFPPLHSSLLTQNSIKLKEMEFYWCQTWQQIKMENLILCIPDLKIVKSQKNCHNIIGLLATHFIH